MYFRQFCVSAARHSLCLFPSKYLLGGENYAPIVTSRYFYSKYLSLLGSSIVYAGSNSDADCDAFGDFYYQAASLRDKGVEQPIATGMLQALYGGQNNESFERTIEHVVDTVYKNPNITPENYRKIMVGMCVVSKPMNR